MIHYLLSDGQIYARVDAYLWRSIPRATAVLICARLRNSASERVAFRELHAALRGSRVGWTGERRAA